MSAGPPARAPHPALTASLVGLAVLTVSFAAILVRFADDAPPVAIAFWRNLVGGALLLPFALRHRARFPRGRPLALVVLAGVMLAAHFGLWIASLGMTTVAASVVLVCTQPLFVVVLARVFLGERVSGATTLGIVVAVVGATIIGGADAARGALEGDLLALAGAVAVAFYVMLGRSARNTSELPLAVYTSLVYLTAAGALLVVALTMGTTLHGFSSATWIAIAGLALGPQLLGHTLLNWALRWVKAPVLSSTILLEPVISTGLAWVLLDEEPGVGTMIGGAVILLGLVLVVGGRSR